MSIQALSLNLPEHLREGFLARAERLVQRAEASRVSRTELALSLAVLSVLCGAAKSPVEPVQPAGCAAP